MPSENAKAVAQEVIKTLGNSRKVILRKIAREKGYSNHTADTPKNITETKSYKDVIEPVVEKMRKERDRAINEMSGKDLGKVQYDKLSKVIDELTKNIQLLSGGATDRHEVTPLSNLFVNEIQHSDSNEKDSTTPQEN